ncbi:Sushi, von Willebrand factor type A, EGF and pentraxin domain-containing protein 1 [Holothuria leucospilota]|uniref:Sushi, von Willebrand factor type A, EGF and pentraxin domain-containing protein 1 n=1 Tax=Holothuria leucospilota TaxID=206669 RepID=A0A9Q1C412_HOLLE|nr:Sushi, von Willebrand factor type A, EGF and pentraxin domain-containing protein 1 [Holothuria leucospilota]
MAQKTFLVCFFAVGCMFGIAAQQCPQERDEVAAGRTCDRACRPGGTCRKQNRECICDGRCGPVCLRKIVDEQCERNDQEIQNQNRRCVRQCESHSDCLRGRRCVCDDACGLSCIPIDRVNHCEDLSSDQTVRVSIRPNNRTFGSIATYVCRNGHDEVGGSNERKCVGSGQWGGNPLTCIPRVRCAQPPEVANSVHNGTKSYYVDGDIVIYRCDFGYYRSGYLPLSRCNRNEWSEIQFQCSPKSCGDPGHILNGRRIGASFVFLGSVEYTCNPGYELRGLSRRYCQADQEWSGSLPTCHPIRCPDPGVPEDGFKIGSDYSYDEIVSYECNTRYILEGQSSIRCQANRTWSAPRPTCRLIQCRRPDEPRNGNSDALLEYYGQQGTVRFQCDRGYTLRGSMVITCNEHEQWSPPPPLCLGQCRIPSCPSHGRWTINSGGWYSNCRLNRMVDPGFRLTYRCDNDYFKCQQIEPVCNDRQWEPDTQNLCVPQGCSFITLSDPRLTASYTYSGTNECFHPTYHQQETVVEYSCNLGYKIRDGGPSQATCGRRGWFPLQQPVCVEVTCPYIQFPYGSVTYQQNGPFTSNRGHTATARFNCIEGYRLEGHTISCDNGIWNDTIPRCVEEPCSVTSLEQYNMDIQYEIPPESIEIIAGLKPAGTTANFICRQYGFEASQTKRCERGRWRGAAPVCIRIPCDDEPLENGDFTYTLNGVQYEDPVHGVVRSYNCYVGYTVEDGRPSQCDAGSWTRGLSNCIERPCNLNNILSAELNVVYNYPGGRDESAEVMKSPGTVASLTCSRIGYETVGHNTRTCRRGEWNGQNPFCERIRCSTTQLDNGVLEYRDIDSRVTMEPKHNDFRIATCNRGYNLQGAEETRCLVGVWVDELPICLEEPCNKNDLPTGDWEIDFNYPSGINAEAQLMKPASTEARFRCTNFGYVIAEGDTKTCRRGQWEGRTPFCERSNCTIVNLKNGRFEYRDSENVNISQPQHEDYMIATCNDGYHLEGETPTRCWNGEWEDRLPTCEDDPCRTFDEDVFPNYLEVIYTARNGSIISPINGTLPGRSVANFTCRESGTRIKGNSQRTCKRGDWRGKFPECENDTCPTENIENGRVTRDDVREFTRPARHGDWRLFRCAPGFIVDGEERSQCLHGEWTQEKPTCTEVFCRIETVANGDITRQDGSQFTQDARQGEWRRVTCNDGFTLVGDMWSSCSSGQWSKNPTCEENQCPAVVNNGEYERILYFGQPSDAQSFQSNTALEVDCAEGRVPEGPRVSFCRRGVWDPPRLLCVQTAPCQEVPAEGGRTIVYTDHTGNQKQHKSNLTVTCEGRMVRFGQNRSTCANGAWTPSVAHCKENLALGKDAYQVNTDHYGHASRAVDGITSGRYDSGSCSHTRRNGHNKWWYVNLGSTVLVQEIIIYNRHDNDHHTRLLGAKVRVGHQTSDVTLNQLAASVNDTDINPIHIQLNPAIEGSILSVSEVDNGNPLTLCEVQVFGELRGCSTGCEVPHLENGYFTLRSSQGQRLQPRTCVSLAQHIYANCQQGQNLRGSYYYRCERSGEWFKEDGDDATCHICPESHCMVPHFENGYYSWTTSHRTPLPSGICTPFGGNYLYLYLFCEDGMQLVGEYYYSCTTGELVTGNPGNSLSSCIRDVSNGQERSCQSPGVVHLVETFVGSDLTPLSGQETFSEGDVITSRCQNAKSQQFHGSVTRRCGGGQWSGDRPRCELTNFVISVGNTALQNVTENGTIIVYPISGYITINCKLVSNLRRSINIYKNNEEITSYRDISEFNLQRSRINNPSEANSGTYKCESIGQSLSIDIIFKDIRCPYPRQPNLGTWRHHRADANPGGLGFIFMETVSLNCPRDYRVSDSTRARCSYHGTWINLSQTCIQYRFP